MIITFSPTFMAGRAFPEDWVRDQARNIGLHFRVKWANDRSTRGVLLKAVETNLAATDEAHEAFIEAIFRLDPQAYVRTALAIYNTKAEFDLSAEARRAKEERGRPIVKAAPAKA